MLKFLASTAISFGPVSASDSFVFPLPIIVVACDSALSGLLIRNARVRPVIKANIKAAIEMVNSAKGGLAPILSF